MDKVDIEYTATADHPTMPDSRSVQYLKLSMFDACIECYEVSERSHCGVKGIRVRRWNDLAKTEREAAMARKTRHEQHIDEAKTTTSDFISSFSERAHADELSTFLNAHMTKDTKPASVMSAHIESASRDAMDAEKHYADADSSATAAFDRSSRRLLDQHNMLKDQHEALRTAAAFETKAQHDRDQMRRDSSNSSTCR